MMDTTLPLIPAVTHTSGTYLLAIANGGAEWEYAYEIQAAGTRSERRAGKLAAGGVDLDAAKPGDHLRTPWGPMLLVKEGLWESGWLLEHTHGQPIDTTGGAEVPVPDEALARGGIWRGRIGEWGYRVEASAMGSKSERRIGWLSYQRHYVVGEKEGEMTRTPWGAMWWMGAIDVAATTDYEQGWLLRGAHDRPLGNEVLPGDRTSAVRLESVYFAKAELWPDGPTAHRVMLDTRWPLPYTPVTARLSLDPNVCSLDAFGDIEGCTKIAIRTLEVTLTRKRLGDPAHLDRRYFAMSGDGIPDGCALIVWPDGDRAQLKFPLAVVPLFPRAPR